MAMTSLEARSNVCLLVMVNSNGNSMDKCCADECSAWDWDDGCDAGGERLGHCALAGEAARPRPAKRKIARNG